MASMGITGVVVQMPNTEVHREWRRSMDIERKASSIRQLNFDAVASTPAKEGAWHHQNAATMPVTLV